MDTQKNWFILVIALLLIMLACAVENCRNYKNSRNDWRSVAQTQQRKNDSLSYQAAHNCDSIVQSQIFKLRAQNEKTTAASNAPAWLRNRSQRTKQ